MKSHTNPSDIRVLSAFQTKKALTIEELSEIQQCSHITSRRRLKQWGALTSYNQNNRYYTLPSIPVFSKEGLWHYQGVSFSKHGTCKQTVIHFVRKSKKGLSNTELSEVLGENPNSLLAHFKEIPGIVKEKDGRDVVYFSDTPEKYEEQRRNRFPPEPTAIELTPDAQAIIMLVELIQHPGMSVDELSAHLQGKGHTIKAESICAVFQKYGIDKKTEYERVRVLQQLVEHLLQSATSANLFPSPAVIHFRRENSRCPGCNGRLNVLKTHPDKRVATLAIGEFVGHETVYYCKECARVFHSDELRSLIPEHCNFGYDIIVFIGKSLFLGSRNYQEIRLELQQKNVHISESEIAFLAKKFVLYLGLLHRSSQKELTHHMQMSGGYILHLDGTCDGASPHLMSVLDGITQIVLDNSKLSSENAGDLIPFLAGIQESYGEPLAVVSDMGTGIALAVKEVFKQVPTFICHFHFLKAIGKNLLGAENDIIRKKLRAYNVRSIIRRTKDRLEKVLLNTTDLLPAVVSGVEHDCLPDGCPLSAIPTVITYTLMSWVLDANSESNGFGFPFDQSYLVFYQRLREACLRLHQLYPIQLQGDWTENKVYGNISHDLLGVMNDKELQEAVLQMEEKVEVFTRLRKAMRITLPETGRGLNDNGEPRCTMKTIQKEVGKFRVWLSRNEGYSENIAYQKLVNQLDLYGEKLFADPIVVTTSAGNMLVQPQRTNNILEQFFRRLMRNYRKRNGFNSVGRVIKTMLPDTPLTMNLKNQEYMQIILDGKETLEERFAELDAKEVRLGLLTSCKFYHSI